MDRLSLSLFVALAILVGGCNAILGNEPHDLLMDATDTADATADLEAAAGDETASQEGGAPSDARPLQDASQDRTIVFDDAGGDSGTRDAVADGSSVSTTCVSGGDCSPNDCQSGTWACVDGGRVCQLVSASDGTPCVGNADAGSHVCSAGKCAACNAGANCADPNQPCVTKSYGCTSGAAVCTARGNAADGVACGAGLYCNGGACAACQVGAACPPAANACHVGKVTACTGGVATCADQGTNAPAGTSCTPAMSASGVCDGSGTCAPCSEGAQCNPNGNTCQVGVQSCSAGVQCKNAVFVQEGKTCGAGKICHAGACGACDGTSCAGGCCNGSGCVTALQTITDCGTGAGGGTCMACVGPSVGTGSAKCASNACTFACTGATPDACPGIGCVDLKTDDANCGQCGNRCAASTHCIAGSCICTPKAAPCGNAVCGRASDGCGKMVTCPPGCTPPLSCDGTGQCVNTMCPSSCPLGEDCGSIATTGCSTLTCGPMCSAPSTCVIPSGSTAGSCKCIARTVGQACGTKQCGPAPDGCGGQVTCPPGCGAGFTCNAGTCCPTCPTGAQCGSVSANGCPMLSCGTCKTTEVCNALSGSPGTCMCAPNSSACAGKQCGQAQDGCGHLVSCPPGCNTPPLLTCNSGACGCMPGQTNCGGTCTNTSQDPNNCGGCGSAHVCPPADVCHTASTCSGGVCSQQQSLAMHNSTGLSFAAGSATSWTVPTCVTTITVDARGASGGSGEQTQDTFVAPGGLGGHVVATVTVTPGTVLTVSVGGGGLDNFNPVNPHPGFNGGGTTSLGGGGGGFSDVSFGGTHLVVAGGGGGGAGISSGAGGGGGPSGANGMCGLVAGTCSAGMGNSFSSVGTGGTPTGSGQPNGGPLQGGAGTCTPGMGFSGGAGGGGYFGGGGGCGGGGGGGSNFVIGPAQNVQTNDQGGTNALGASSVDGSVTIRW